MTGNVWLKRLGSAKLALWLIGILIVMNLLSVIVPQRIILGDSFSKFSQQMPVLAKVTEIAGLDRLFTGWPIALLSILLAVNVTACTVLRLARRRAVHAPARLDSSHAQPLSGSWEDPERFLDAAAGVLGRGWRVLDSSHSGLVAMAGRLGFWGSMLLHASLLVMMVGGALSAVTSFRGELFLTTGQAVFDTREAYNEILRMPQVGPAFTGARIALDSMDVIYDSGQVVGAVAKMRAFDDAGRLITKDVRVNYPLDVDGKSYLVLNSGYAAAMRVEVPGAGTSNPIVRLSDETPFGWRDQLELPAIGGKPAQLRFLATPVPLDEGVRLPQEKYDLSDPRLRVKLVVGEQTVWEGRLASGESTVTPQGVTVDFERLTLWNKYLVRSDPARWVTYIGFWMAVIGAMVRFAVPERRVVVTAGMSGDVASFSVRHRARPWIGLAGGADAELVARIEALATAGPHDDEERRVDDDS